MGTAMPATRPADRAARSIAPHRLAQFRPGQLVRSVTGATFRVARDGTRVHYAAGCRRNVIHIDGVDAGERLPSSLLRVLLARFAAEPDQGARRTWRLRRVDGTWYLSLEVRCPTGRLTFPEGAGASDQTPGVPVNGSDLAAVETVCAHLWAKADAHANDSRRPADLEHLRQVYGPELRR